MFSLGYGSAGPVSRESAKTSEQGGACHFKTVDATNNQDIQVTVLVSDVFVVETQIDANDVARTFRVLYVELYDTIDSTMSQHPDVSEMRLVTYISCKLGG